MSTLVVVGRDDEFTPVSDAEYMHERIPTATLAVIEGAGHLPNLKRPSGFNRSLHHFLAEIGFPAEIGDHTADRPTP